MSRQRVTIYTRPGCHLCEEAKESIRDADCAGEYILDEINIETDPTLLKQYQDDIPVVLVNGEEAFRHRVAAKEFRLRILSTTNSDA